MEGLSIMDMNETFAKEIVSWKYESPYDFYNIAENSIKEFLKNEYYAVVDRRNQLVGFLCLGKPAQIPIGSPFGAYPEGYIDIGIGIKPELTGRGNGSIFFSFVLNYIERKGITLIRLSVAKFNHRAIHLYEKFGFVKAVEFSNESTEFMTMVRDGSIFQH
ncbi:Acetyltransferase (GNAT) family protein [Gracilibacillus orientalis]|uniref:Acetyltransferase (GNAT) family protein n=1 Tax=Gracilibacillus orientalis TaxID=334253 RepID=A0A1I4PEW2_9BACI|nr:GNAT family N-acetyltransferase [Gracilibacillus orientalis]SFM26279.1 Acetyltransferase (GNAT) family protein [Gracilibacillus orientalis]